MLTSRRVAGLALGLAATGSPLMAGAYFIGDRVALDPTDPLYVGPYAIVHPIGWTGGAGVHEVKVCAVNPLKSATKRAVFMWNNRAAMIGNCGGTGCFVVGEPAPPEQPHDAMSAILHELGHCAFGLSHSVMDSELNPSRVANGNAPSRYATYSCDVDGDGCCGGAVDFSPSANAVTVLRSPGTPQGSSSDEHRNQCPFIPAAKAMGEPAAGGMSGPEGCEPCGPCCATCPGPTCPLLPMEIQPYSWFRKSDNNPFVVDASPIDFTTFGRLLTQLPAGHKGARNANRAVGEALVPPILNTQAVMYPSQAFGQVHLGLSADDVNMLRMAETGIDRLTGTPDDYRTFLRWVEDCTAADVIVDLGLVPGGDLGFCFSDKALSFPQGAPLKFHYSLILPDGEPRLPINLNIMGTWDYGPEVVFLSGFETGDSSEWTSVEP